MADKGTRATTHSRDAEKVDERKRRAEPDLGHAFDLAGGLGVFDSLLAGPGMELPVEKHAALLGDARFAHPANSSQKARMVGRLQNDYGNAHVQRVVQSIGAQPSAVVGPADNRYDRDAHLTAGTVMEPAHSHLQVRTTDADKHHAPRTKMADATAAEAPHSLESRITSALSRGEPLDDVVRASIEPRFGIGLGGVRVHADAEADELSRQLDARAFTTGNDVFFRSGHYQPRTTEGQRLLVHELTHVVQQVQSPSSGNHRSVARQAEAEESSVATAPRPPGYEDVTSPARALGKEAAHQILIPVWNNAELVEQAKRKDAYLRGYSDDLGPEVQSAIAATLLLMFAEMDRRVKALPLKFGPDGLILPPEGVRWKSAEFAGIVEGIDPFHMADPFWQTYSRKAVAGKRPTVEPKRGPSTTRHTFEEGETVTGELPSWARGGAPPPGSESARPGKEIGPPPEPKLPKGVPIKPRISLNPLTPPITIAWDLLKNWIGAREEGVEISARDISIEVTAACLATMASKIPYQRNPSIPPPSYDFIKPILDRRLKEAGGAKNLSAAQAHARGRRMGATYAKRFIDDLQKSSLNTGWGEAPVEKGGAVYLWWLKYKYKERAAIYGYVLTLLPKPSVVSVKERYRKKRGR